MAKITAPNRGYNGISAGVVFKDGVGETDNPGALAYFRKAGYEIEGDQDPDADRFPKARTTPAPEGEWERPVPDTVSLGSPLRDAAVDPIPSKDFLPPTNAGLADPHGPLVVSPGLHGVPPAPITPGPVDVDDVRAQEATETAIAEEVLVNNTPATEVTRLAEEQRAEAGLPGDAPAKRDPKPVWVEYATSQGMDAAEAEAMSKADLVEKFGG